MKKDNIYLIIIIVIVLILALVYINSKPAKEQTVFGSGFDLSSCEQITEKDIYDLCLRIYDKYPGEFEAIVLTNKFHQHIGPNNIYGAKMALYAKKLLDGKSHEIQVISEAGTKPPISCLNDGIMVAIGSTFGRGLIENIPYSNQLAATFIYKNKSVRLEVKSEKLKITQEYIANSLKKHGGLTEGYFDDVRKMGLFVWENMSQEDLFIVTYPFDEDYYCEFDEFNLNGYFNRLHNFLHTSPDEKGIIAFIENDDCVYNGSVGDDGYSILVSAVWNSNNETVLFRH